MSRLIIAAVLALGLSGCAGGMLALGILQAVGEAASPPVYTQQVRTSCVNFGDYISCTSQ